MLRHFIGLVGLSGLWLTTGCTPSGFLAHQFIRAPKTFPTVVAPEPRVYFNFPNEVTDLFPEQLATVGRPPIALDYRIIPPGDYGVRLVITNHVAHGQSRPLYRFPAHRPTQAPPARGTVVLLHGYGLDHQSLVPWALTLAENGWRCVLVDLRGHGKSEGTQISFGIQEAADLSALVDELERREQASWPVSVLGVSYGAAVALRWATTEPRIQAVVAITPYDRLTTAVDGLRRDYAAWIPAGLIRRAAEKVPGLVGVPPGGLDPEQWLDERPVPALFVAAGSDPVAPASAVQKLAHRSAQSRWLELPATTHEMAPFRLDVLKTRVIDWLDSPSGTTP